MERLESDCIRGVVVYHEVAFHIIGKMTNYAIKGIRPLPTNVKEKKNTKDSST